MNITAPFLLVATNPWPIKDAVVGWMVETLEEVVRYRRRVKVFAGCGADGGDTGGSGGVLTLSLKCM
jgi:hypothetical protein